MDIEKLLKVQERMRAVLNEEKPLVEFEDLAKATGLWEVVESGSVDEPCVIRLGGCDFLEEDESSATLEYCDEEKLQQEGDTELGQIEDALEGDAISGEQAVRVKKAVLTIKADFLIKLRYALWGEWSARIEKRMQRISEEIPGFEYREWEELGHYVFVDGERYSMDHWYDHDLEQAGRQGKTVDELAAEAAAEAAK